MHAYNFPRLPFDWKTPFGYAFAMIGFFAAMYAVFLDMSPNLSFTGGSCWLIVTFVEDITNELSQFSADKLQKINHRGLKERFCDVLQQLSDIKQLSTRVRRSSQML